jgi:hypothetical protein
MCALMLIYNGGLLYLCEEDGFRLLYPRRLVALSTVPRLYQPCRKHEPDENWP